MMFVKVLMPSFKTKCVYVTVYIKFHKSIGIKKLYKKEIHLLHSILHYNNIQDFLIDLNVELHMYKQFIIHWKEVDYIVFKYNISNK
jgi:hypothetical protein